VSVGADSGAGIRSSVADVRARMQARQSMSDRMSQLTENRLHFAPAKIQAIPFGAVECEAGNGQRLALRAGVSSVDLRRQLKSPNTMSSAMELLPSLPRPVELPSDGDAKLRKRVSIERRR
jgi:hypothetical protein